MFRRALRVAAGASVGAGVGLFVTGTGDVNASCETCKSLFGAYATEERGGVAYMTVDDFVKSLLRRRGFGALPAASTRDIEALFRDIDSDADGLLSFQEFSIFMTLLTNPEEDIERLFRMFDTDNSNTVEFEEYKNMIRCLSNDRTAEYTFSGGLVDRFFGPEEGGVRKPLGMDELLSFIASLRRRVVEAEFKAFTAEGGEMVLTHESFVKLLFGSRALPEALGGNWGALQKKDQEASTVHMRSWLLLNDLADVGDQLADAFEIYKRNGHPVDKHTFIRGISAVDPKAALSRSDVELFFLIFGDADGMLNDLEFSRVLRAKRHWGMKTTNREEPRRNFVQSVFSCMQQSPSID